jgi:hypothetical protein
MAGAARETGAHLGDEVLAPEGLVGDHQEALHGLTPGGS